MYDNIYTYLTQRGCKPIFYRVNNELADDIKQHLEQTFSTTLEIVLAYSHQKNTAKYVIRTTKNYIISILASTYDEFPLYL